MPRKARGTSPLEVRRLKLPGRWSVGGVDGLALQVTASGARSWVLRLAGSTNARDGPWQLSRCPWPTAREKPPPHRHRARTGRRPERASRPSERGRRERSATVFAVVARSTSPATRSPGKTRSTTRSGLPRCGPTPTCHRPLLVRDVATAHVIGVLEPIWTTKTELPPASGRVWNSCSTLQRRGG